MYRWIVESGYAGMIVATKADKLSKNQRQKAISVIGKALDVEYKELIFPYSAVTRENIDSLWDELYQMTLYHKNND